jgi:hypothetical protein
MKTSALAPARPSTASRAQLRRLAVVGLVAPVVALAACSGGSGVTANPTGQAATTPASTSTSSTTASPSTSVPSATAADASPVDQPATIAVKASIKDPDLGHTITASRVSRHLPWPSGQPVASKQFEIVGVMVTLKAGSRYSASIAPSMLSLVAKSPAQSVMPTAEFGKRWNAAPLAPAGRSQARSGWVFFKVNRGTGSSLSLTFSRPAYQVSTTGRSIPAKTFSAVLVK